MVHNIRLEAIMMVYFPNNSLNINALNLAVCWIFILRHNGTEKCSLFQKIIIKKKQILQQILLTLEFSSKSNSNRPFIPYERTQRLPSKD